MTWQEKFSKFVDAISVEGNTVLGFAAVALYYIIMYFVCNDYFMAVKMWDIGTTGKSVWIS